MVSNEDVGKLYFSGASPWNDSKILRGTIPLTWTISRIILLPPSMVRHQVLAQKPSAEHPVQIMRQVSYLDCIFCLPARFILLEKCPNSRIKPRFQKIPMNWYLKFRSLQRIIFSSNFNHIIRTITIDNICAFYGERIPSNLRDHGMSLLYWVAMIDKQVDSDQLSWKRYLSMTDLPGASP